MLWPTPQTAVRAANTLALVAGLRDAGYVEERNLILDIRGGDGKYDRLTALATEVVGSAPDVIVASTTPAALALKQVGGNLPVVMAGVTDPVGLGLIKTLGRPGTNFTGFASPNNDLAPKYLEFLRIALPNATGIAVLLNPGTPSGPSVLKQVLSAAGKFGIRVMSAEAENADQIRTAFGRFRLARVSAVLVAPDTYLLGSGAPLINELAIAARIPSVYTNVLAVELGGFMTYGADLREQFRNAARYIDRIFKGAKPDELPVEEPANTQLVINRRTAKAIGLEIPQELLLRAGRVIE
jgi:putative tryptophan/tyrosine transport system substrate-binding protein